MLLKIGDPVRVIAGRDRGETGKVLKIDRVEGRVMVEGINKVYKHVRKSQRNPQGGRLSKEAYMDISNVAFICPQTGKPTRLGTRVMDNGTKERYCKVSGVAAGTISAPKKRS
jgi:large subunit ribosomal protein L24